MPSFAMKPSVNFQQSLISEGSIEQKTTKLMKYAVILTNILFVLAKLHQHSKPCIEFQIKKLNFYIKINPVKTSSIT